MARKKNKEDLSAIANLPILNEDSSVELLLKRVKNGERMGKEKTTEQKLIILKILALNSMQWTLTANQVGIDRKTLRNWWGMYGELINEAEPIGPLVQEITNEVTIARGLSLKEWYGLMDDSAKKLREHVNQSKGTRSIYAIVEAVRASTEVIKLEKEMSSTGEVPGGDFFMGIHNMMVKNIYGDGNKD